MFNRLHLPCKGHEKLIIDRGHTACRPVQSAHFIADGLILKPCRNLLFTFFSLLLESSCYVLLVAAIGLVLVGTSKGKWIVILFAHRLVKEVTGVLLLDLLEGHAFVQLALGVLSEVLRLKDGLDHAFFLLIGSDHHCHILQHHILVTFDFGR